MRITAADTIHAHPARSSSTASPSPRSAASSSTTIPRSGSGWPSCLTAEPDFRMLDSFQTAEAAFAFAQRIADRRRGRRLPARRPLRTVVQPQAEVAGGPAGGADLLGVLRPSAGGGVGRRARRRPRLQGRRSAPSCATRSGRAAHGDSRLPLVPPAVADSLRHRLDPTEQAIYGMMSARTADPEIAATLGLTAEELEARSWTMLRKLERIDASRS